MYRFILFDLGQVGRFSDGGVLSNSEFSRALDEGSLQCPPPCPLPNTLSPDLPYVIIGDEAFPICCDFTQDEIWQVSIYMINRHTKQK